MYNLNNEVPITSVCWGKRMGVRGRNGCGGGVAYIRGKGGFHSMRERNLAEFSVLKCLVALMSGNRRPQRYYYYTGSVA